MEEEPPSPTALVVTSPRRTLSLLRDYRATTSAPNSDASSPNREQRTNAEDDLFGAAGFAGAHGPKPSEVYGFVGSITSIIATVVCLVWAYIPGRWLHSVGITYYPSKYWALAVPTFVTVPVVLVMMLYLGLNFLVTPPPCTLNTIYDEYSCGPTTFILSEGMEKPIDPISDVGINQINHLTFGGRNH